MGNYFSKELDVTYSISKKNDHLILSYPTAENIALYEGEEDVFGSNRRTKYSFHRDKEGNVVSFKVASEGTVNNIHFGRIE